MVYAGSSYEKRALLAIRLEGAIGDITGTNNVAWSLNRHTPYVPSPLLYEDKLYFLKHYQGTLSCVNAMTGSILYGPMRLPDIYNVYASPVGANGKVYIISQHGAALVLKHGSEPEILAVNYLDDNFSASPAIADADMYLRGHQYLYCISKQ